VPNTGAREPHGGPGVSPPVWLPEPSTLGLFGFGPISRTLAPRAVI